MVPQLVCKLVRVYFPGNGRIQGPSRSVQGLLSLHLQRAHHYVCHFVLAQTGHEASRDWSVRKINRLLYGRTCKVMVQRIWIQGRKEWGLYLQSICHTPFFPHCNISEIGLIISAVLGWLQPGFPSNSSRDNLCLLLPVTWSMTNLKPLSNKVSPGFSDHTDSVNSVGWTAWLLASCSYFRGHIFSLSPLFAKMEVCKFSGSFLCVSTLFLIFLMWSS